MFISIVLLPVRVCHPTRVVFVSATYHVHPTIARGGLLRWATLRDDTSWGSPADSQGTSNVSEGRALHKSNVQLNLGHFVTEATLLNPQ